MTRMSATLRRRLEQQHAATLEWAKVKAVAKQWDAVSANFEMARMIADRLGMTETEKVYGEVMPVRYYRNHCNACNRRWTVRIASVTVPSDAERDNCPACYTGPFATYSED